MWKSRGFEFSLPISTSVPAPGASADPATATDSSLGAAAPTTALQ